MTRAVFFGTPALAVRLLEALSGLAEVLLVVTRPDRPRGRSGRPRPPPVKEWAEDHGFPVAQPARPGEVEHALRRLDPDVGLVVAYGRLLPPSLLDVPRSGILNVHLSLLPRWRGAAPVERAILAGDAETGVSLMLMDEGLDTGPVVATRSTRVGPEETAGDLSRRLAELGAELLAEALPAYLQGRLAPRRQDERGATTAPKVTVEEARLDLSLPASELERRVRAFNPRPGAWAELEGERFKVLRARPTAEAPAPGRVEQAPGEPVLGAGAGGLQLLEVQPAGRRPMSGRAWMAGRRGEPAVLS